VKCFTKQDVSKEIWVVLQYFLQSPAKFDPTYHVIFRQCLCKSHMVRVKS